MPNAAVSHVRDLGKDRLRDRWSIISAAPEGKNVDDIQLDRPTCETTEGDNGVAWALAIHVARRLGYTPQETHTQARGLFGASLPYDHDGECPYSLGWQSVSDLDDPADLLVGSYVHAHAESVRTVYERGADDDIERSPRPVVLDEFPGEAFSREFDEEALDHACWLAAWADDGYAHSDAHHLLEAVVTPTGDNEDGDGSGHRVSTSECAFDDDATDDTVLASSRLGTCDVDRRSERSRRRASHTAGTDGSGWRRRPGRRP